MAVLRKNPNLDTWVNCPSCLREIAVSTTSRLPAEFSVVCPNCGQRKVHRAADVHEREQGSQTAETSDETGQFGQGKLPQQTSRLSEWASWLLQ